jgi:hypothetical protein
MLTVACVRTGTKYGPEYVWRLQKMVSRHLTEPHQFICFTDDPAALRGIQTIDIGRASPGWFGKMELFAHQAKNPLRMLYFDLDTVIAGSLKPLSLFDSEFGICGNFSRAAGNTEWPCRYGSCVMAMAPGFGGHIAEAWRLKAGRLMQKAGRYGDQMVIEWLHPAATTLQDAMPRGFFLGYRDITSERPAGCAVVVFAGNSKPHNCDEQWIKNEWTL